MTVFDHRGNFFGAIFSLEECKMNMRHIKCLSYSRMAQPFFFIPLFSDHDSRIEDAKYPDIKFYLKGYFVHWSSSFAGVVPFADSETRPCRYFFFIFFFVAEWVGFYCNTSSSTEGNRQMNATLTPTSFLSNRSIDVFRLSHFCFPPGFFC